MAEYIEREAFKAEILRLSTHYLNEWDTLGVLAAADRIPASDVREVKRGVWCPQPSDFKDCTVFVCSNCGHMILISNDREELPYCGNCGADMREES